MSKKYEFDKKYFRNLLSKGVNILIDPNTNKQDELDTIHDIHFIKQVVAGSVPTNKYYNQEDKNSLQIEVEWILFLERIYKQLGEKNINYLIELSQANIFSGVPYDESKIVTLEEQEFLTLKTYEKHSKKLLSLANEIVSPKPTCQIHEIKDFCGSSFEHFSFLANLPFIVVDPKSGSYVLNHEIQHGIEDVLKINRNDIYKELGAILFELLNNDMFIKENGFIYVDSYGDRISDSHMFLQDLADVFKIMKDLAKSNFIVSDETFQKIVSTHLKVTKKISIYYYLTTLYSIYNIEEMIIYLLSFIKAVELREQLRKFKGDKLNILTKYISKSEVDFNLSEEKFKIYQRYEEEMESNVKSNI